LLRLRSRTGTYSDDDYKTAAAAVLVAAYDSMIEEANGGNGSTSRVDECCHGKDVAKR